MQVYYIMPIKCPLRPNQICHVKWLVSASDMLIHLDFVDLDILIHLDFVDLEILIHLYFVDLNIWYT